MNILVVDDEESSLEEIEQVFKKTTIDVRGSFFRDPYKALKAVNEEDFDAAFLDIQMPGINGVELAEQLLNDKPEINIVFITAHNHYATEAFKLNVKDYLLKPIRFERVEKTLKRLAEHKWVSEHQVKQELSIYCLGSSKVFFSDYEIRWNRGKTKSLFWYLLTNNGQWMRKERICELLWPEFDLKQALSNLQVTIYRLRKDLNCFDREQIKIVYANNCYCITIGDGYWDVNHFIRLVDKGSKEALEEAANLYKGSYLQNEGWIWAEQEKELLKLKYEYAMHRLAEIYLREGLYREAEILLASYLKKEFPNEILAKLYMQSSYRCAGKKGLTKTYHKICKLYMQELDEEEPVTIHTEYLRLKTLKCL